MPIDRTPPSPKRNHRWRGWLINLVLILLIFTGVQWWKARPLASGAAPLLAGRTLDGRALDLADLRGQPVLIHFWASWCPVCKVMEGAIAGIAQDHAVITVALQSGSPEELQEFMRNSGHNFPVIADPDGHLARRWGVQGVPATLVVDAAGRIRFVSVGVSTGPGLRLRLWRASRDDSMLPASLSAEGN